MVAKDKAVEVVDGIVWLLSRNLTMYSIGIDTLAVVAQEVLVA